MKQNFTYILSCCVILLFASVTTGQACVGRILTVSVDDSIEQKLVGQLLATYVTERTGTTVNMITVGDGMTNEQQIEQAKADIILNYLNVGLTKIEGADTAGEEQENYGLVKQHYVDELGIVWLRPLGYKGPLTNSDGASLAIPVTTRDVLNRFPVLDRVINKLSGRLDERTLQQLIKAAETDEIVVVVKNFLKDQNLI